MLVTSLPRQAKIFAVACFRLEHFTEPTHCAVQLPHAMAIVLVVRQAGNFGHPPDLDRPDPRSWNPAILIASS